MAACKGLQHVYDNPLPENPTLLDPVSFWDGSSFTELRLDETRQESSSSGWDARSGVLERSCYYPDGGFSSRSCSSLAMCTEGLGFESSADVEELTYESWRGEEEGARVRKSERGEEEGGRGGESKGPRAGRGLFPPPISCIGRGGKPWVCFKSYREEGRFVLKEMRMPTREVLHACREDGRLKLQLVHSDDEIAEEEEEEDSVEDDDHTLEEDEEAKEEDEDHSKEAAAEEDESDKNKDDEDHKKVEEEEEEEATVR